MRLTANEVRSQILRRFKSSRLRQKMAPPIWVGPFLLRRVVRIWEELALASDGSSRLRRQKTLTLSGGGFCLSGNRRVRIWEEFARIERTTAPLVSAAECVIAGDHLHSEGQSEGSSHLRQFKPIQVYPETTGKESKWKVWHY